MRGLRFIELAALAAWGEFLCLRLLIRAGAVLPQSDVTSAIGNGMAFVGVVALNLALLLMLAALFEQAWQSQRYVSKLSLFALAALTLVLFILGENSPVYFTFIVFALLAMGDAWLVVQSRSLNRIWLGLFIVTYFLLGYAVNASLLKLDVLPRPIILALAELFAVVAVLGAPFVLNVRFDWRAAMVAAIGVIVLGGMWLNVVWLPPTIMIWTLAFTGYLSPPVYILAFGVFLYVFIGLALRAETRRLALGLSLSVLGGLRWDYPYYTLLALSGFLLITQNLMREEEAVARSIPMFAD